MKDKKLILAVVVVLAVVVTGVMALTRAKPANKPAATPAVGAKVSKPAPSAAAVPAKKTFSKEMGGLTVKLTGPNGKESYGRVRAFRAADSRSGIYVGSFTANRMQELMPGTYDIEVETLPSKIYKGIRVSREKETVEDLGCVAGSLAVKMTASNKKSAAYPVRIFFENSNTQAAVSAVGRTADLVAGVYDIEIGSLPKQVKKGVIVEAKKSAVIDLGTAGALLVKAVDEEGKEARGTMRIKRSDSAEIVASGAVNRAIDLLPGSYTVEIASKPPQTKSDIKVNAGETVTVEVVMPKPPAPAAKPAPAAAKPPAATASPASPVKR